MDGDITREEIFVFQEEWARSVVNVGKAFLKKDDFIKKAEVLVGRFYGYAERDVLFKPTKARQKQFRFTFESAVSYFVGGNPDFNEDSGFALTPWTKVRFENSGFIFNGDSAFSMGNYFFTNLRGNELKVEYTIGYFRSANGSIKIFVHHSSIPYKKQQIRLPGDV